MAIMHPVDIENYTYTGSEKLMYDQLRTQLPEKYHVFYSIRWFETRDGARVDSECDFLVFDPSFGYITIEVKGGVGLDVSPDNDEWIIKEYVDGLLSYRKLGCSPYVQAEKSMRHFFDYFHEEFMQNFRGTYGFAVAFPFYTADYIVSDRNPKEVTIDKNDMGNLQEKINRIFHYWRNRRNLTIPFSMEQRERFIRLINKRISIAAAAGSLIDIKKAEFEKINLVQDNILDALSNFQDLQFVGGAGTGKTFIAVKKAIRDYKAGKRVLVTCSSEELSQYIYAQLLKDYQEIDCFSFKQLMVLYSGEEKIQEIINIQGDFLDVLPELKDAQKYDSIIVDEAQDFDEDMGLCITAFLKVCHKTFYVFYDENQNIYARSFGNAFDFKLPPIVLRYNIRNTGRIYSYATNTTGLGTETVANILLGVEPEVTSFTNEKLAVQRIENIVNRLVQKEYVPLESIIILSNMPYEDSILRNTDGLGAILIDKSQNSGKINDGTVSFFEAQHFKGMESDIIIYINHTGNGLAENQCAKYVALTRARYFMYIINVSK